jgi:hypothetical protein
LWHVQQLTDLLLFVCCFMCISLWLVLRCVVNMVSTVVSIQEIAQCIIWFVGFRSLETIHHFFFFTYVWKRISRCEVGWLFTEFRKISCVLKQISLGRPGTAEDGVESKGCHVYWIPNKSTAQHSLQLSEAEMIQTVLWQWLRWLVYRIQLKCEIRHWISEEGWMLKFHIKWNWQFSKMIACYRWSWNLGSRTVCDILKLNILTALGM